MATDSPSTSSLGGNSSESLEVVLLDRRGRGRRRGAHTVARRGRGGVRGKRKRTGAFILTEDEVDRLEQLQIEKKRRANELVDDLSENGAKKLLKAVAEKMPSIIFDVAKELEEEGYDPEDPIPDPEGENWPSWCICHRCREMPNDVSKVCCGMRPDLCTSIMPEMRLVITEPGVLQVQQLYRNDIFARHAGTIENINKSMRHAAYRQYILFQYGRLGAGVRRPVPSCCTWFIRDKFPDPNNQYVDYDPGW